MESIFNAAQEILSEQGIDGFTIQAVASRAGVSVGGVYRRFADKQELLRALKDRVLARLEDSVAAQMAKAPSGLENVLQLFAEETSHYFSQNAKLFTIFFTPGVGDTQMAQRGGGAMQTVFGSFSVALLKHRDRISHENPELAVRIAFDLIMSPTIHRTSTVGGPTSWVPWEKFTDELVRAVLAYLTREGVTSGEDPAPVPTVIVANATER